MSLSEVPIRGGDSERRRGEPAWEVATVYPEQGYWGETDYLELTRQVAKLVECSDGFVEVLPMPSRTHQKIVAAVYQLLMMWSKGLNGVDVYFAPLPVRLGEGRFREPDLMLRLPGGPKDPDSYISKPTLVVEVVSEGNRDHDLVTKRAEYAEAGIPEYWIVDPSTSVITVLKLAGGVGSGGYETVGEFGVGTRMTSVVLAGLSVDVGEVFAAAKPS